MIEVLMKAVGAAGILVISAGVLKGQTRVAALLYIIGGSCLEAYSIYIGDAVFIILQLLFILTSCIAFIKTKPQKTGKTEPKKSKKRK